MTLGDGITVEVAGLQSVTERIQQIALDAQLFDLTEAGYRVGLDYLYKQTFKATARIDHIAVEKLNDVDREYARFNFG